MADPARQLGPCPHLEPCPFCGQPLNVVWRLRNPRASCGTEGCFGSKGPVVNLDDADSVAAWNHRGGDAAEQALLLRVTEAASDYKMALGNEGFAVECGGVDKARSVLFALTEEWEGEIDDPDAAHRVPKRDA